MKWGSHYYKCKHPKWSKYHGGSKILLEDKSTRVFLDFCLNFYTYKKFL